jgi:hypothetical protein
MLDGDALDNFGPFHGTQRISKYSFNENRSVGIKWLTKPTTITFWPASYLYAGVKETTKLEPVAAGWQCKTRKLKTRHWQDNDALGVCAPGQHVALQRSQVGIVRRANITPTISGSHLCVLDQVPTGEAQKGTRRDLNDGHSSKKRGGNYSKNEIN